MFAQPRLCTASYSMTSSVRNAVTHEPLFDSICVNKMASSHKGDCRTRFWTQFNENSYSWHTVGISNLGIFQFQNYYSNASASSWSGRTTY